MNRIYFTPLVEELVMDACTLLCNSPFVEDGITQGYDYNPDFYKELD